MTLRARKEDSSNLTEEKNQSSVLENLPTQPASLFTPKRNGFYRKIIHLKFFFISLKARVPSVTKHRCWESFPSASFIVVIPLGAEGRPDPKAHLLPTQLHNGTPCPDEVLCGSPVSKHSRSSITPFCSTSLHYKTDERPWELNCLDPLADSKTGSIKHRFASSCTTYRQH